MGGEGIEPIKFPLYICVKYEAISIKFSIVLCSSLGDWDQQKFNKVYQSRMIYGMGGIGVPGIRHNEMFVPFFFEGKQQRKVWRCDL